MISTSGSTLLPEFATTAYLTHVLPLTPILTPNIPEALLLAKLAAKDFGSIENLTFSKRHELATFLASMTQRVLLKGGHLPIERNGRKVAVDVLVNSMGESKEFVSDFS